MPPLSLSGPRRAPAGFTLIELLTVIAIIGVLAAIMLPVVGRVRESARGSQCVSNMRQLGLALSVYAADNRGRLPGLGSATDDANPHWDRAALGVLSGVRPAPYNELIKCPSDTVARTGGNAHEVRSYTINPVVINNSSGATDYEQYGAQKPRGAGIRLDALVRPARTALLLEKFRDVNLYNSGSWISSASIEDSHRGGMNIVMCDASVRRVAVGLSQNEFIENHLANR